jgi:iron only hydrogenase large subunit-like protein
VITGCAAGCFKFVEYFYPDLAGHLSPCKSHQRVFGETAKAMYPQSPTSAVSIFGCIAQKYTHNASLDDNVTLTVNEIARMFKLAGINFTGLPETAFDTVADSAMADAPEVETLTVYGFAAARVILDSIRRGGYSDAALVRIMSCPNGREMEKS